MTPAEPNHVATTLKSIGAVLAAGGLLVLTGLQQGQNLKQSGIQAGVAALTTLLGYLAKSPVQ